MSGTADRVSPETSPSFQGLLVDARARMPRGLTRQERLVELTIGATFVAAAILLALLVPTDRSLSWSVALLATVVLAIASCVVFEVGASYTMPTQAAFVPMLFVLPPELAPAFVAAALTLGKLAQVAGGGLAWQRVAMAPGDAWFAVGPALLLALAGAPEPAGADWPLYLAALASQFAVDSLAWRAREMLHGQAASIRDYLAQSRWLYLVDALLAPVGLGFAFAATAHPWTLALLAPLSFLLLIFARERLDRLESLIELSSAYRGTAYVLGDVVEHDDAYTGMHSRGVVELALRAADELGLDPSRRRIVEFAALLHDVGKIAMPKRIINKPGALDAREWEVIRTHTVEGQRILDRIGGLMHSIGRVVRSSYERYDGSGYPDGLSGEEIPLESRIVFCCDAFSAMTTDRPYRPALSVARGLAELERNAGSQFDPAVVMAVMRQLEPDHPESTPGAVAPRPRHGWRDRRARG